VTYESFPLIEFGKGLNLRDKPDAIEPDECIDAMNVLFGARGAVEQRPGYGNFSTEALPGTGLNMEAFYTTSGLHQLVVGGDTWLRALNGAGGAVATDSGYTAGPFFDFARFGKPNEEVLYAGNGKNPISKWNGVAFSKPTGKVNGEAGKALPMAGAICVDPNNNRLVCSGFGTATGGPNGAVSSPSHVYFSEPGEPESYVTTSVLVLTPGDGERIQAVIAWREFVFIFKETKFFVLTGNERDSEGNPVFEPRPIETGIGLSAPKAVCVHPTGVYFVNHLGLYRTSGQEPEPVSSMIEPVFHTEEEVSPFFLGGELNHTFCGEISLGAHEDRIYLGFAAVNPNDRTLLYDTQFQWWSIYDLPMRAVCSFDTGGDHEELLFADANGIFKHAPVYPSDAGAAIESHWRSGWWDLDSPDVKTIRSSKFWGTGKVFAGLGTDFRQGVGTLGLLDFSGPEETQWDGSTWGGGQWSEPRGLIAAERRIAARGTVFSLYLSNNVLNQPWSVSRVAHHLRETKRPSVVRA
jgi:hypothetical protein